MAANDAAGVLPGRKKVYGFKAPPRLSRARLTLLGMESALAGRRDGGQGIPDPEDSNLPASVHRRVDQANAWMNGKLARRYYRERNKLQGHQRKIEGAVHGLSQTASSREPELSNVAAAPAVEDATSRDATTSASQSTSTKPVSKAHVRKQSTLVYLGELVGIFACEGFLNKKAFELFGATDTITWILVSGLAIALILASHMIGKSWRRVEDDRKAVPALAVLCVVAIGAAGALGVMRYLTVDNQRQQTISVLNQEIATVQNTNTTSYMPQLKKLQKQNHLSPVDRRSVAILTSRIAAGNAVIASAKSQLLTANHPQGVDRGIIAIPLFLFLNIFLTAVASVLSYYHYDPEAAAAAALRGHARRLQFAAWLGRLVQSWRERRMRRRRRREQKRQRKDLAATNAAAASRRGEHDARTRHATALTAAGESLDDVLANLDSAYRAACSETEKLYGAIIRRYWAANTRVTAREARSLERDWTKANHRAVRKGHPTAERPEAASVRRPKSQDITLPFQRPPELA